jgi:hypothetical protein
LTTAESLQLGKRKDALKAWADILKSNYGVDAQFIHLDKDMAEIGMAKDVWPNGKISLCWWHMRKAARERLAKSKLSTTPYLAKRANNVFRFIDITFVPPGQPDRNEYEGGKLPKEYLEEFMLRERQYPSQTTIKIPPPSQPYSEPLKIRIHLSLMMMIAQSDCSVLKNTGLALSTCWKMHIVHTHKFPGTRTHIHMLYTNGQPNASIIIVSNTIYVRHGLTFGKIGFVPDIGSYGHAQHVLT